MLFKKVSAILVLFGIILVCLGGALLVFLMGLSMVPGG